MGGIEEQDGVEGGGGRGVVRIGEWGGEGR